MAASGTFLGEVQRGWRRFWNLRWRWKGPIIAFSILAVIIALPGPSEDGDAPVAAGSESSATEPPTTGAAVPTEPSEATSTEPGPTDGLASRAEEAIQENEDAVEEGGDLTELSVDWDEASATLAVSISPDETDRRTRYLTRGSALAIIAGEAVWANFPEIQRLVINVQEPSDDDFGNPVYTLVTTAEYSRPTGERYNFPNLRNQPSEDNKTMYCTADFYAVEFALWDMLDDKGCMSYRAGGQNPSEAQAGILAEIRAERPQQSSDDAEPEVLAAVGQAISLPDDGWILTVTRVTKVRSVSDFFETKTALGVYVVVEFRMENFATEKHALCGNRFEVRDDLGREYEHYLDGTYIYGAGELCSDINPGLSAPAVVLFDIPSDATGLVLQSLGGFRVDLGDVTAIPFQ